MYPVPNPFQQPMFQPTMVPQPSTSEAQFQNPWGNYATLQGFPTWNTVVQATPTRPEKDDKDKHIENLEKLVADLKIKNQEHLLAREDQEKEIKELKKELEDLRPYKIHYYDEQQKKKESAMAMAQNNNGNDEVSELSGKMRSVTFNNSPPSLHQSPGTSTDQSPSNSWLDNLDNIKVDHNLTFQILGDFFQSAPPCGFRDFEEAVSFWKGKYPNEVLKDICLSQYLFSPTGRRRVPQEVQQPRGFCLYKTFCKFRRFQPNWPALPEHNKIYWNNCAFQVLKRQTDQIEDGLIMKKDKNEVVKEKPIHNPHRDAHPYQRWR